MNLPKLSASLADRLANAGDGEMVDLVVELRAGTPADVAGSRMERIAAARQAFERDAAPVQAVIESAGGEVTGAAWINQTLHARIPAREVRSLADVDAVLLLDLARALERG